MSFGHLDLDVVLMLTAVFTIGEIGGRFLLSSSSVDTTSRFAAAPTARRDASVMYAVGSLASLASLATFSPPGTLRSTSSLMLAFVGGSTIYVVYHLCLLILSSLKKLV